MATLLYLIMLLVIEMLPNGASTFTLSGSVGGLQVQQSQL